MLLDLVKKSRSYRSYNQNRTLSEAELLSLAEHARLTASGNNRQLLRLRLVSSAEEMGRLLPCLKWAAALPDWHLPPAGHAPTAAIVLCHDAESVADTRASAWDVGIKGQTILLAASECGLGGCMIANFTAADVSAALALPARYVPVLVVALGEPDEEIILEDLPAGASTAYYRDADGVHHVPKRTMEELIIK